MSDQPFTITATRSQLITAMLDMISDVDLSDDGPGAGHAVDAFLHYLDPKQFPVHPADAPAAIATGPTSFQPYFPGCPQYHRADSKFLLLHDKAAGVVKVLGPAPYASGSISNRPVVHTVTIVDGDLATAIASASHAVDHMQGR